MLKLLVLLIYHHVCHLNLVNFTRIIYFTLDELTPAKDGSLNINMEDDVIRGMTVVKDGSITYPPPKIQVSVAPKQAEKKVEPIVKPAEKKSSVMPAVIALASLFLVGAFAPASL